MTVLLLSLALGCSAHRTGLVEVSAEAVLLRSPDGAVRTLSPRGEGAVMARLDGCIVDVQGVALARRQWVRSFTVVDAGDGTPPYYGVLRRYGGNWLIEDQNTGQTLMLSPDPGVNLAPLDGRRVLVQGVVVGAQTLRVMAIRSLEEPAPTR